MISRNFSSSNFNLPPTSCPKTFFQNLTHLQKNLSLTLFSLSLPSSRSLLSSSSLLLWVFFTLLCLSPVLYLPTYFILSSPLHCLSVNLTVSLPSNFFISTCSTIISVLFSLLSPSSSLYVSVFSLSIKIFMENLMVIRVEVIAPEKPLLSKHLQK